MDTRICPRCKRRPVNDSRARFCSPKCRWNAYWNRNVQTADRLSEASPVALPPDLLHSLPPGPERSLRILRATLVARAPAHARAYRLGLRHGLSKTHRWFPPQQPNRLPFFQLDPFEIPRVPHVGTYAVVYFDDQGRSIGGPQCNLTVDMIDSTVRYSQGARGWRIGRGDS